jgi:hypothetical protein
MEEIIRIVTEALEAESCAVRHIEPDKGHHATLFEVTDPDNNQFFITIEPA